MMFLVYTPGPTPTASDLQENLLAHLQGWMKDVTASIDEHPFVDTIQMLVLLQDGKPFMSANCDTGASNEHLDPASKANVIQSFKDDTGPDKLEKAMQRINSAAGFIYINFGDHLNDIRADYENVIIRITGHIATAYDALIIHCVERAKFKYESQLWD